MHWLGSKRLMNEHVLELKLKSGSFTTEDKDAPLKYRLWFHHERKPHMLQALKARIQAMKETRAKARM